MKRHLALFALVLASVPCLAQQGIEDTTPSPGTAFEWKYSSDGSLLMALNAFTLHEAYFNLPFGLDFGAGAGFWLGSRSSISDVNDAQAVMGFELYGTKNITRIEAGTLFIKGALGLAIGPRTPEHKALTGYASLSAGIKF